MAEEKKTRTTTTKGPQVQDLSRVLEEAGKTILDLDQRLANMRRDLDALTQTAGLPMPSASGAQGAVGPGGMPLRGFAGGPFMGEGMGPAWQQASGSMTGSTMMGSPFAQMGLGGGFTTWSARQLRERQPALREPQADIVDAGSEFLIQMEVPGVKKDDLDIMATDRGLVITAEYRPELEDEGIVVVSERGPIAYRRTVELPSQIQTDGCKANLKDGLLTLRVPKKSPSDGAHHVNVAYT